MTKKEKLLEKLKQIAKIGDVEEKHSDADEALVEYINDADIKKAYNKIEKWYA